MSFHWTDGANGNSEDGRIQLGENATVDCMDPLTGKWAEIAIWQNPTNSRMELDYGGGAWVSLAVSESPVPEPSHLVHCAAIVAFGLLIRHRTKRSQ